MRWCAERGMTHYVYAPKDDPKQRHEWREPYTEAELDQFRRLATEGGGLTLGCSVSPGLSIDYRSGEDRALLMAKIESVCDAGAAMIQLQFDDIPHRPELGVEHADITSWVHTHLAGRAELVMCPVEYVGWDRTPYLDALADGLPEEVSIAWTGRYVVNETITVADADARAAILGGRKPSLWDNFPVNDGMMSDQLFIGPLRGRDPELLDHLDGIMFNALVQPRAGLLPLASCAAYLRGEDPVSAWRDEAQQLGWLTFAEACDGAEPRRLVAELVATGGGPAWSSAAEALAVWLRAAAKVTAPGIEDEVPEFLDAVRDEAAFCLKALRLYQDTKPVASIGVDGRGVAVPPSEDDATRHGMGVVHQWKRVRRREHQVLGARLSTKVAMRTASTGGFSLSDEVVVEDRSATDALVRAALDQAAELSWPVEGLTVGGTPVGEGGRFVVPAGGDPVVVQCGDTATRVSVPGDPPLPERRLASPG